VSLRLTRDRAGPHEPVVAEVVLRNAGEATQLVNARFSMGYPDTDERDVYLEILRHRGEPYLGYRSFQVDYHARSLSRDSFEELQPGEELIARFPLEEWYPITEPGSYLVRAVYEPEPSAALPEAVTGTFRSEPRPLRIDPPGAASRS
jgi:hypothetical protein